MPEFTPRRHWLVCVMWLMPVWAILLIVLSAKWLAADDPGWLLAVVVSFFTGFFARGFDSIAGKFCMIFAGVLLLAGLVLPSFVNVCY